MERGGAILAPPRIRPWQLVAACVTSACNNFASGTTDDEPSLTPP